MEGNRRKKPPIDLRELEREKVEERKPGSLSYVPGENEGRPVDSGKSSLRQIFISALIAVALAAFMMVSYAPSKGNLIALNANVKEVAGRIESLSGKIDGTTGRLETVIGTMGEYAKKTDLAPLSAQIDSRFAELKSSYEDKVASYEERIAELEARIVELEEEKEEVTAATSEIDAVIETQFFDYIYLSGANTETVESILLRLKLTNNSNVKVEDIRLTIAFTPEGYTSVDWADGYPQLAGGPTTWTSPYGYGMVFVNGWGMSLKANESKSFPLTLSMKVKTALTSGMRWTPEVYVEQ